MVLLILYLLGIPLTAAFIGYKGLCNDRWSGRSDYKPDMFIVSICSIFWFISLPCFIGQLKNER